MAEAELERGETIVWLGQPRPGRLALRSLPIFFFAIPWTAFAVFWMVMASGLWEGELSPGRGLLGLFGVPFVLIGLAMLSAPLWTLRKARRTLYAVTDRRAIIFDGGWSTSVRSFDGGSLGEIQRRQKPDGSGDILFGLPQFFVPQGRRPSFTPTGFLGIPDVREVEQLLRALPTGKDAPEAGGTR